MHLRAISKYKVPGGLIFGECFALQVLGAHIWRGLYVEGIIFGILGFIVDFRHLQHSREIVKRLSYRQFRANKLK